MSPRQALEPGPPADAALPGGAEGIPVACVPNGVQGAGCWDGSAASWAQLCPCLGSSLSFLLPSSTVLALGSFGLQTEPKPSLTPQCWPWVSPGHAQGIQLPTPTPSHCTWSPSLPLCSHRGQAPANCHRRPPSRGLASWGCLKLTCHGRGGCHQPLSSSRLPPRLPPRPSRDNSQRNRMFIIPWPCLPSLHFYVPVNNPECSPVGS